MNDNNSSRTLAIEMVGYDKHVLEIGTACGDMTKILKERRNAIIRIEINHDDGLIAQQYCEKFIFGDVERLNLDELLQQESFDVILLTDVLEHLTNPFDLLEKVKKFLKPDGYMIVSLPNICHGDVLLNLLNGDFHYTPTGLIDKSHLRFFGLKNIISVFSENGFEIIDLRTTNLDIGWTEQKVNGINYSDNLTNFLQSLPYSSVYQFVFKIIPSNNVKIPAIIEYSINDSFTHYIDDYANKKVTEELKEKNSQIFKLEYEIFQMKMSLLYQFTQKFDEKILDRFLPPMSGRRILYHRFLDRGRILISRGFSKIFPKYYKNPKRISQGGMLSIPSIKKSFTIDPSGWIPPKKMNIAVHAHIYYPDVFEEICQYLQNIQVEYALYISVKSSDDKVKVIERVKKLPNVIKSEVQIVQNRGRDIAPFLVQFGSLLREHDLICHIHTKKSLFTGEEKIEWRKFLLDRVLGSKDNVNAIFKTFTEDPSIGIIYPEIFPSLPYWACTWLSNKHTAPLFLEKFNIRFDPDEYFDYPIGSMFWIRKDALKPLLDLKLSLSDFPIESGQNDGALQHTIERCFAMVTQNQGFNHLVVQDPTLHRFSYQSTRNFHKYLEKSYEEKFFAKLSTIENVAFDIFDTLLIRPFATPNMVFSFLENQIANEYHIFNFKKNRILAESIARKTKNYQGDVKITEIYKIFSEITHIDSNSANKLLELEVKTKTMLLTPRNAVVNSAKAAKKLGKRIVLISDTYLERKYLEKILLANGIDFFDEIYLSCEIGKRKDRGDLWDYIFEKEKFTRHNFMHIGDNEQSDLQIVGDRGFITNVLHVMRPTALFRQSEIGILLWDRMKPYHDWRENLLYGTIGNYFCSDPDGKNLFSSSRIIENNRALGYVIFGPIIFNFLNWLIKTSIKDNFDQIWFIAREGYLLKKAYQKYLTHPNLIKLKDKFPTDKYILSSRRAAIFTSLRTEDDIPNLLEGKFRGTLRDFFTKRLCIKDIDSIEERISSESLDRYITLLDDYEYVSGCVRKVFDILIKEANPEREAFLKYLYQQGFEKSKRITLVDVGYSGTIQSALGNILNYPMNGYYFFTTTKAAELSQSNMSYKSFFNENVNAQSPLPPLFRYSLLLEAVLTAPVGQFIRFENINSSELQPVFKEPEIPQKEFSKINQIHEGILEYITDMIDKFGLSVLDIEFPNDLVQVCFEQVIKGNIQIGTDKSLFVVEDEYCGNAPIEVLDFYKPSM